MQANNQEWKQLQGKLILLKAPKRASVYLEGPSAGTDLLVDSFSITPAQGTACQGPPFIEVSCFSKKVKCKQITHVYSCTYTMEKTKVMT